MPKFSLVVPFLYQSKRMDAYLVQALEGKHSRSQIKACLDAGKILLNGKVAKPSSPVVEGDRVEGEIDPAPSTELVPEKIPIKVVYEDDSFLVIDKPIGMVVHPGAGNKTGTLVHALLGRGQSLSSVGGSDRPGIVHRIDKETSGLLLVAKTNEAHRKLQDQFQSRTLGKTYYALVRGRVEFEQGHIEKAIGRHEKIRQKMTVSRKENAREAETHYKVIRRFKHSTFLEVKILTGRTHQIRVHMADLGYPVVGDKLYGRSTVEPARLCLHAAKLEFAHPKTGKMVRFESPLPKDFEKILKEAEKEDRA